jgi:multiple sugar transport system permease protein
MKIQEMSKPGVPPLLKPPLPTAKRRRDERDGKKAATIGNIVLLLFGVLFLVPLLWMIFASFDSQFSWSIEIPHFTFSNYRGALANGGLDSLWNSLVLSLTATLVSTVAAVFAAYALVRHRIPWKGPILLIILFMTGIPISITVIPIYEIYVTLGWLSILPSAVFLGVTFLPFEIWLLKNYIEALPVDLEEAAKIERANTMQILWRIILPLAMPGIGAAAIFGFVSAWGSLIIPLVLISSSNETTGPITIFSFMSASNTHFGNIAAFSMLYSIPVLALYASMSRLFQGGFLLRGAVKG